MNTGGLRLRLVFLTAVVLLLGVGMVEAQASGDVVPEGLTYSIGYDDTVTITGYTGSETALVLPGTIEGKPVKSIGYGAFFNNLELQGVIIPSGITSIESQAFYGCSSLNSISISGTVNSIGSDAFSGCSSLRKITLPAGVKKLESYTFANCSNLNEINLSNITSYDYRVFFGCSSLKSVNLAANLTSIPSGMFDGCGRLDSVNIPASVTSIGGYAFKDCVELSSIKIPDSVTSIGEGAFENCYSLYSVNLPKNLTKIESNTFYNCSLSNVSIPPKVSIIGERAFYRCKLTDVILPNSVTTLEHGSFMYNDTLQSITIPINVKNIATEAIYSTAIRTTIRGFPYSYAEQFAKQYHYPFEALPLIQATEISLSSQGFSLNKNEKYQLIAQVSPDNATYRAVTWTSSNPDVAMVTADGQVMAVATGQVLITATAKDGSNVKASCPVAVLPANVGLSLNQGAALVPVGGNHQLVAQPTEADASLPALQWTSSKEAVATVDQTGLVTGMAPGAATITATATDGSGMKASSGIQVYQSVTSISLEPEVFHLEPGASLPLVPQIQPENAANKSLVWSSSDESVATVDAKGLVKALVEGKAIITAKTQDGSGQKAESQLMVSHRISKVNLDKAQLTLNTGETQTLTASIQPDNATDRTLVWASNEEAVATMNQEGLVTGVEPGEATISATAQDGSDVSASCAVTVVLTGDADGNDKLEIADLLCVIDYLVNGIECPAMDKADTNGNDAIDLNDLIYILDRLIP